MSKTIANLIFNFALIVILSVALYATTDWPSETALFPQVAGTLVLALSVISFGMELFRLHRAGWSLSGGEEPEVPHARSLAGAGLMLLWLAGFGVAIWVLGFYLAALVFLFLFIRLRAKDSIAASLGWSVTITAVIFLLFSVILKQSPYDGMIVGLIFK